MRGIDCRNRNAGAMRLEKVVALLGLVLHSGDSFRSIWFFVLLLLFVGSVEAVEDVVSDRLAAADLSRPVDRLAAPDNAVKDNDRNWVADRKSFGRCDGVDRAAPALTLHRPVTRTRLRRSRFRRRNRFGSAE